MSITSFVCPLTDTFFFSKEMSISTIFMTSATGLVIKPVASSSTVVGISTFPVL